MAGNKCSDFSIDNLLKSETKRNHPEFFHFHRPSLQGVQLKELSFAQNRRSSKDDSEDVKPPHSTLVVSQESELESQTLSWLNCTRFNPPKVTRSRKKGSTQERCIGRGPRIPFSPAQIAVLENTFSSSRYLSSDSIARLANALDLSNDRVKIWFQNRRARYKRERIAAAVSIGSQFTPRKPNTIQPHNWTSAPHQDLIPHFFVGGSSFLSQTCHGLMHA